MNVYVFNTDVEKLIKLIIKRNRIKLVFFFSLLFDTDCTICFLYGCKSLYIVAPPGAGSLSSFW